MCKLVVPELDGKGVEEGRGGEEFFYGPSNGDEDWKRSLRPLDPSQTTAVPASQWNWKGKGVREKAESEGYFQYIPDNIFL